VTTNPVAVPFQFVCAQFLSLYYSCYWTVPVITIPVISQFKLLYYSSHYHFQSLYFPIPVTSPAQCQSPLTSCMVLLLTSCVYN